MPHNAPSPSLSFPFPSLFLLGLIGAPAFGQSNVRPAPEVGRAPAAGRGLHLDSRTAEEAGYGSSQDGGDPVLADTDWDVEVDLLGTYLSAADLEGDAAERSVLRGGWDVALTHDLGDRSTTFFLETEASFYDWSASAPFVGGSADPFNDLYQTRVGALASFDEDEALSWFTGMELTLAGEDSSSIQDSASVGAVTGVTCRASEDVSLGFGLAVLTRIEDTTWILPYIAFDLQLTDRVRLGTDGARVELEAELSERVTGTLAAQYELRQFRLNEDNALPEAVYQDDEIRLSAELDWELGRHATLSLAGGAVVWQESTFLDDSGSKLAELESDPAPFALATLRFGS
jgi:hypothetical protein